MALRARIISDAVIGLSDGLTVPFALTAGLSAFADTRTVIYGGLAELIAGAISMGLGGYLAAKSEQNSWKETLRKTHVQMLDKPDETRAEIKAFFGPYKMPKDLLEGVADHIAKCANADRFMMELYYGFPQPAAYRAIQSAITIALGYLIGGIIPLISYFFVDDVTTGLYISCAVMTVTLFIFGYTKQCAESGWKGSRAVCKGLVSGVQLVAMGGTAAGAAYGLVKLFNEVKGFDT